MNQIEDQYWCYKIIPKDEWTDTKDAIGKTQIRVLKTIHEIHKDVTEHRNLTERYLFSELLAQLLRRTMIPSDTGSVDPPWTDDKIIVHSITNQIDFLTQIESHGSALETQEMLVSSLAMSYNSKELQEHVNKLVQINEKHRLVVSGPEDIAETANAKALPLLLRSTPLSNSMVVAGIIATGTGKPDQTDYVGRTALHLVLEDGAIPPSQWEFLQTETTPRDLSETMRVVEILLEWGVPVHVLDTFQRNVLHIACWQPVDYRIIQRLLEHPYFMNGTSIDLKDSTGRTPFAWAVRTGQCHVAKLLLATGRVNVNTKDEVDTTPLCFAAQTGKTDILQLLLSTPGIQMIVDDNTDSTPLELAFGREHDEVMKLLIPRNDVDVNITRNDGTTQSLLIWAVRKGRQELVKLLLKREDIKTETQFENFTARQWAVLPVALGCSKEGDLAGQEDVLRCFEDHGFQ